MILADLAAGQSVFLDANVLVYHFAPDPVLGPHCARWSSVSTVGNCLDSRQLMCSPRPLIA